VLQVNLGAQQYLKGIRLMFSAPEVLSCGSLFVKMACLPLKAGRKSVLMNSMGNQIIAASNAYASNPVTR